MKWSAVSMESFESGSMGWEGGGGDDVGRVKTREKQTSNRKSRSGRYQVTSQQTFPNLCKKQLQIHIRWVLSRYGFRVVTVKISSAIHQGSTGYSSHAQGIQIQAAQGTIPVASKSITNRTGTIYRNDIWRSHWRLTKHVHDGLIAL